MAIDVKAEAEGMKWMTRADLERAILSLVTRAVAEAKREQMEADCKAVCLNCECGCRMKAERKTWMHNVGYDSSVQCDAYRIRSAFAATEQRDAGKGAARQRFDKAAVELARRTKCIEPSESMVVNNSPDPGCECPACVLMIAARELGIDGAA